MKELRSDCEGGVWRVAFAFDTERAAILLVGGDKGGADQWRFYKKLIAGADARFEGHLATIKTANVSGQVKEKIMAKNLNDVLVALPPKRRAKVEQRAGELAALKDLRLAVAQTNKTSPQTLG